MSHRFDHEKHYVYLAEIVSMLVGLIKSNASHRVYVSVMSYVQQDMQN